MALQSPSRKILGLDHSFERVAVAQMAGQGIANLVFRREDFRNIPKGTYEGLVFLDVLHYLSYRDQEKLLRAAYGRLRKGGTLLFRDVDRRPGLASLFNRIHETLMTSLGFTKAGGLHFRTLLEWVQLAEQAGFKVRSRPTGRFPFADVLFICHKA